MVRKPADIDSKLSKKEKKRMLREIILENIGDIAPQEASPLPAEFALEKLIGEAVKYLTQACHDRDATWADQNMRALRWYCDKVSNPKLYGELCNLYEKSFGKKYEEKKK